ncbi:MAG: NAD(P)H-dependent oxidoreductase [Patescibacteria group bacterium]|nr:NAD(P)H-dependent oxidoreductase [Patescibacteria group bacterium]
MYMPVILGTAREGRQSEKAAKFVLVELEKAGLETELVDVRDFLIGHTDNTGTTELARKWAEKMKRADGLIIVSPEYNHSFPGELKLMLDALYQEYMNKPIGICGVSAGPLGGARAVEQLRLVSVEFHLVPIREAVYFSEINELFEENGEIKDAAYSNRVKKLLDELIWYAKALKTEREKEYRKE